VLTFFITQKSLGGHAKTSVTLPLLKMIKFHAVGELSRKYRCGNFHEEIPSYYWYSLFRCNGMIPGHTFLNARNSFGGHAKNFITSPLFKLIKFCLA